MILMQFQDQDDEDEGFPPRGGTKRADQPPAKIDRSADALRGCQTSHSFPPG